MPESGFPAIHGTRRLVLLTSALLFAIAAVVALRIYAHHLQNPSNTTYAIDGFGHQYSPDWRESNARIERVSSAFSWDSVSRRSWA